MRTYLLFLCIFLISCDDFSTNIDSGENIEQKYFISTKKVYYQEYPFSFFPFHKNTIKTNRMFFVQKVSTDLEYVNRVYLHQLRPDGKGLDFGYNCYFNDSLLYRFSGVDRVSYLSVYKNRDFVNKVFSSSNHSFISKSSKVMDDYQKVLRLKPLLRFKFRKKINSLKDLKGVHVEFPYTLEAKNTALGFIFKDKKNNYLSKEYFTIQYLKDTNTIYLSTNMMKDYIKSLENRSGRLLFTLYYLNDSADKILVEDKFKNKYTIPVVYNSFYSETILELE